MTCAAERTAAHVFPGLIETRVDRPYAEALGLADPSSTLAGELVRQREVLRFLREKEAWYLKIGASPETILEKLEVDLYGYFHGTWEALSGRTHVPMYRGDNFSADRAHWVNACGEVDDIFGYLEKFLPESIRLRTGSRVRLASAMREVDELRGQTNPVELIKLAAGSAKTSADVRRRHQARVRLILAQLAYELRRAGYDPETLSQREERLGGFLRQRMFAGEASNEVRVLVTLDPRLNNAMREYRIFRKGEAIPRLRAHQYVLRAKERVIKTDTGVEIPVLVSLRGKKLIPLKMLLKQSRATELLGIGDALAMRFVVNREHHQLLIDHVRKFFARLPGCVADQVTNMGKVSGMDGKNSRTSSAFEAAKFVVRVLDTMLEVQFPPMETWVGNELATDGASHLVYKLNGLTGNVFPVLFPFIVYGIPWTDEGLKAEVLNRTLAKVLVEAREGHDFDDGE